MPLRPLHPRRSPTRCSSSLSRLRERVRERALLLLRALVPLLALLTLPRLPVAAGVVRGSCRCWFSGWLRQWFRPAGRVTFVSRDKSNQKRLPRHPALRFAPGSFAPSPFQGRAAKGHPWPIASLAASMPLNPFHDDSAHPPEGAFGAA